MPPRTALSRTQTSHGQEWGNAEEMLATIAELLDMTNRLLFTSTPRKGSRVWKPLVVPRPYAEQHRLSSPEEVQSFFRGASGKVSVKDGDSA